ncbi:hypothetical protein [Fischerella sp. PCC 9605]|uniref:hypothetical protein n=1 Tax=Fischerella sp. PCC 9605 TaxID=1173024 RepID=UPI0004B62729|nr:hypothetical protein [Fischerella sp. PCC 9605]
MNQPNEKLSLADFHNINLFNSNLVPQIKAVEYHLLQGNLRDVWLISSESKKNVKGSEDTANILEQYLRFQYGQRLDIHSQKFIVKDWDYATIW